jgi:ABC-type glycerol-3-phosphate transport system substrate-binding protein
VVARQALLPAALLSALAAAACAPHVAAPAAAPVLTPEARSAVQGEVRKFMEDVAAAVTAEGPIAWRREFANRPEFFMASDGVLVFADGAAAAKGIDALAENLPKITLAFDDLRTDALTPDFAVVGANYSEVQEDGKGLSHTDRGYFTGLAERSGGHWQLRSAHWSSHP